MENNLITRLNKEADEAVAKIRELEMQISEYKTGAESFEEATKSLQKIEQSQSEVISKISQYIGSLEEIDFFESSRLISELSQDYEKKFEKIEKQLSNNETKTNELVKKIDFIFKRKLRKLDKR